MEMLAAKCIAQLFKIWPTSALLLPTKYLVISSCAKLERIDSVLISCIALFQSRFIITQLCSYNCVFADIVKFSVTLRSTFNMYLTFHVLMATGKCGIRISLGSLYLMHHINAGVFYCDKLLQMGSNRVQRADYLLENATCLCFSLCMGEFLFIVLI